MSITITADGTIRFIWNDQLAELAQAGTPTISRVSHVEPTADGKWTADMGPIQGPVLGPFVLHSEAIAAEHRWLEQQGY